MGIGLKNYIPKFQEKHVTAFESCKLMTKATLIRCAYVVCVGVCERERARGREGGSERGRERERKVHGDD